jgi:hypothetical protein
VLEFDEYGVRYVPASGQPLGGDLPFHCVGCGSVIAEVTGWGSLSRGLCCKACGMSVLAALAPPSPIA